MKPPVGVLDANEAVASVAYRASDLIAIYPITPASAMGELADVWSSEGTPNLWGAVPKVVEMQSEGGAAGAVHGGLQAGALATTFTASQGLLLMLPDLYKIAGELTPFCLHVAARALATHALSIFGDHSDVMSARSTGFAMLASGSAQEAQDLAAIAHAATLRSRVPFLSFFDGFRTSHEITKLSLLSDADLAALLDPDAIAAHRARALNPDHPVIRGTSQNPDTYFQAREAVEPFYRRCPSIVAAAMDRFASLTGRRYGLFDYVGHPSADRVIVLMGSGAECVHETVERSLEGGERVGVIKVRLYRPFAVEQFLAVLPKSARSIAVLDRTKEPGSIGEPLYLDVVAALAGSNHRARVIGGRYGLASKELTPAMVRAVFDELAKDDPRPRFTLGIRDDVSFSSLSFDTEDEIEPKDVFRAVFFGLGSDGTVSANKSSIKIIGEKTDLFVQGHFEYDSKKSGSTTASYLRFGPAPIRSTYRPQRAEFVAIHAPSFLERRDLLELAAPGATVLINAPIAGLFESLPRDAQRHLIERRCKLFAIDAQKVAQQAGLGRRINTVMQVCFFALSKVLPLDVAMVELRKSIEEIWGAKGAEVVRKNLIALENALGNLKEVPLPAAATNFVERRATVPANAPDFVQRVTRLLLEGQGDRLPVSAFPADGTWPLGTAKYEKRAIAAEIPIWQPASCVQCNRCVTICPHAAIRAKVYAAADGAPDGFRSAPEKFGDTAAKYTLQVAPEDCTGCGLCVEICPAHDKKRGGAKALVMEPIGPHKEVERAAFEFFEKIQPAPVPPADDDRVVALREPLFEFSGACSGCGETPYLRMLTQLFGDRLLIANATGCSSIFGGNLPTTPYTTNRDGRGPAWANSLFEDNAEFGLGMRLAIEQHEHRARALLSKMAPRLPEALFSAISAPCALDDRSILSRREQVKELRVLLRDERSLDAVALREVADYLVPKTVWIVGGDGWAYDIGYGGLDHVLASGEKVNVLVLDTEVYSNTGGQQSKATPIGASAKFATAGKQGRKKDLGLLAMSYGHVYVAEIALQTKPKQALAAFLEAEQHPGPSLLIAHAPCIAHGYDLVCGPNEQKRAINSGMWPLYRFDPRRVDRDEPALLLDSGEPTLDVAEYMKNQARFQVVDRRDHERYLALVEASREAVKQRRALYEMLSHLHTPHRAKS